MLIGAIYAVFTACYVYLLDLLADGLDYQPATVNVYTTYDIQCACMFV